MNSATLWLLRPEHFVVGLWSGSGVLGALEHFLKWKSFLPQNRAKTETLEREARSSESSWSEEACLAVLLFFTTSLPM